MRLLTNIGFVFFVLLFVGIGVWLGVPVEPEPTPQILMPVAQVPSSTDVFQEQIVFTEPVAATLQKDVTVSPGQRQAKTQSVEEVLEKLLPPQERARITHIIQDPDGPDGTLAYVEPANEEGSLWTLAYDPEDTYTISGEYKDLDDLLETLIHEYAHVLFLNDTQVEHVSGEVEYVECFATQIIIDEGCVREGAYLEAFVEAFWDDTLRDAAYEAEIAREEDTFATLLYEQHPTTFVTEYAATNAVEDIAESFVYFVLQDSVMHPVTTADQKVHFFSTYPELEALRMHMLEGVAEVKQ